MASNSLSMNGTDGMATGLGLTRVLGGIALFVDVVLPLRVDRVSL